MEKLDLLQNQSDFIKSLELKGKSFNTIKNYKTDLNIFNQFLQLKDRSPLINEITLEYLKEYDVYLGEKYNSPNSIRRRIQALRIFFDYLIEHGLYDQNPVKKMLVSPKIVDIPRPLPFVKVVEFNSFLTQKVENSEGHEKLIHSRNRILFQLIYGAGLKVSDIERVELTHILNPKSDDHFRIMIVTDKKEPYTVVLPETFKGDFESYIELLQKRKTKDKKEFSKLLFNGNPFRILNGGISSRGIEVIFKDFTKQIKEPITAKTLRQACIFKWLSQDIPESRIKEWMGVQPQYSLKAYKQLLENAPHNYTYMEV